MVKKKLRTFSKGTVFKAKAMPGPTWHQDAWLRDSIGYLNQRDWDTELFKCILFCFPPRAESSWSGLCGKTTQRNSNTRAASLVSAQGGAGGGGEGGWLMETYVTMSFTPLSCQAVVFSFPKGTPAALGPLPHHGATKQRLQVGGTDILPSEMRAPSLPRQSVSRARDVPHWAPTMRQCLHRCWTDLHPLRACYQYHQLHLPEEETWALTGGNLMGCGRTQTPIPICLQCWRLFH